MSVAKNIFMGGRAFLRGRYCSVRYLFWQLVPADAVATVGAQLPLHRLGGGRGGVEEQRRLGEGVVSRVGRHQGGALRQQRGQLLEAAGGGPPPAPVGRDHRTEAGDVDERPRGAVADRQPGQQVRDVVHVLGVELE